MNGEGWGRPLPCSGFNGTDVDDDDDDGDGEDDNDDDDGDKEEKYANNIII